MRRAIRGLVCAGIAALVVGVAMFGAIPSRAASPAPDFVRAWGSLGSGNGQFNLPTGIAVDSAGYVYVAETDNHRVQKFTADGTYVTQWGTIGSGNGQFNLPHGIAVDASNNVYVADSGNNRIQKFTSTGAFITTWNGSASGNPFFYPTSVAVGPAGDVAVSDDGNHRIQWFSSSGVFITKWGGYGTGDVQFAYPRGVVVDASGNTYVTDTENHRVQKIKWDGSLLAKWGTNGTGDGQFANPQRPAVDAAGNLYVADVNNHRVQVFSPTGGFITKWGSSGTGDGQFNQTAGVAIGPSGDIYVTDRQNHRVQQFAYDTTPPQTTITSGPHGTTGDATPTLAFDASEAGSTFECSIDSGVWSGCTSPHTTGALADGWHLFQVRATDAAGNPDATPALEPFTVLTTPGSIVGWGYNIQGQAAPPTGTDYVAIAAGDEHSLALRSDGSIAGWGANWSGQATPPAGNDHVAIAAGRNHGLALRSDGTIVGWGSNTWGQATSPAGSNFVGIAAGEAHGLALRSDGSIIGWGYNGDGRATPPAGNDLVAIAAGAGHSLALRGDGSIVGWGHNAYGQATPPAGSDFVAIAAGFMHSLALRSDGSIVGWGYNDSGQASPPAGTSYVAIAPGYYHSLALRSDSSIVAWGSATHGRTSSPPGNEYVAVAAGWGHGLAISTDVTAPETALTSGPHGTTTDATPEFTFDASEPGSSFECRIDGAAWTICASAYGPPLADGRHLFQVRATDAAGNTDPTPSIEPFAVLVAPASIVGWGWNAYGQANPLAGNDYLAVAAGYVSSHALRSDGSIVGWGYNLEGDATPPGGNDYVAISTSQSEAVFGIALRADGTLAGWGYNSSGQANPPAGSDYVAVAAGAGHGLALRSDGSLVGWGSNGRGQASPPAGNDYMAIAAGYEHSLALRSDGSIVGWGDNGVGQASPPAGNDYVAIAAGCAFSLALRSDGSIVGWGNTSSPTGNDYVAIAAGCAHSLALRSDGTVVGWGGVGSAAPGGDSYVAIDAGGGYSLALAHRTDTPTTTTVTSDANPMVFLQPVTFTVTVAPEPPDTGTPTGDVGLCLDGILFETKQLTAGQASFTYTSWDIRVGTRSFTAIYNGDADFNPSTSAAYMQTVDPAATSTTVTSDLDPAGLGQAVTLTAIVTVQPPSLVPGAHGTVTFMDGATSLCVAQPTTWVSGKPQATCGPLTDLAMGEHGITAVYTSGDSRVNGSTSPPFTQHVGKRPTTTTVTLDHSPSVFGEPVTFTATVVGAANGDVRFWIDGNPWDEEGLDIWGSVTSIPISTLSVGSHDIRAEYLGDEFASSSLSDPVTQQVTKAYTSVTITTIEPAGGSIVGGSYLVHWAVDVNAPGSGTPSGTVTISGGSGCSSNEVGRGYCAVVSTTAGPKAIVATYSGDTIFNGNVSAPVDYRVDPADTSTAIYSSSNPSVHGDDVTFTATVTVDPPGAGTPTGTVTFKVDGMNLPPVTLEAAGEAYAAVANLGYGNHVVTATYDGDGNFNASTSDQLTQTVGKANSTTIVTSDHQPSVFGQAVTFTVEVGGDSGIPTGTVQFIVDGSNFGSSAVLNDSGWVRLDPVAGLSAGSHSISAVYAGDSRYNGSASSTFTQSVSQAATTTVVVSDANPAVYSQTVTFTATVTADSPGAGTPAGTVQFMQDGNGLGWPEPLDAYGQAHSPWMFGVGATDITAVYSGDGNFDVSTSDVLTQTINRADSTVTLESDLNPSPYGQGVTFTATTHVVSPGKGVPQGTVDFFAGATQLCAAAPVDENLGTAICGPLTDLAAGDHLITASYSGNANYVGSSSDPLTQTITAAQEPDTFITTGPTEWTNHNTPSFEFHSDNPNATFECTMDSGTLAPCTSPYHSPALADGGHSLFVRAVLGSEADQDAPNWSFFVDTTAPYTGYAEVVQQLGGQVSSAPIEIYWQASDNLIHPQELRHEWQWRKKVSGTWQAWQAGGIVDELEATFSQPFAKFYQYRIRSVDLAGNWGVWEETDPVKLLAKQEAAFTKSTGWIRHAMTGAWGGKVITRAKVGAWAKLTFSGTGVALVMPTGVGQGTINVCLDPGKATQQCSTINLATFSPTGLRHLVAVFDGLTSGSHVLKVTIVSGTVNLDGAIVRP